MALEPLKKQRNVKSEGETFCPNCFRDRIKKEKFIIHLFYIHYDDNDITTVMTLLMIMRMKMIIIRCSENDNNLYKGRRDA